ncbi:MAG: tRNA (adenosine(37)-N6)-threonylcarbamoyltransferase complex ATPase subunit type 1 TsaE [Bacteriovoracaceae bacterium]|nr:tRNA (adenosine(37)-N6)-threonylcarbamoyltransferase complex ATPase subunit type 1 TsaE [Bacteriovoracaceae bacterium]
MSTKLIREWKKVYPTDLPYIVYELKELTKVPALIILDGPMGVGKTTFSQQFIGESEVFSPSYSILSEHAQILHGDFYRIETTEDIFTLEIPVYLEDKQYFLAEWGNKFSKRLLREIPETWSSYILEIGFGKPANEGEEPSRNFSLSTLIDD